MKKCLKHYSFTGINYILENLDILTSLGRKKIRLLCFEQNKSKIMAKFDITEKVYNFLLANKEIFNIIRHNLSRVKDIGGILEKLESNFVLDDIEFFEIKNFIFVANDLRMNLLNNLPDFASNDFLNALNLLDPDRNRIPSFYIYDSYLPQLKKARFKKQNTIEKKSLMLIQAQIDELEYQVRRKLSKELKIYVKKLLDGQEKAAILDIEMAKALQAIQFGLHKPIIADKGIEFYKLFNPEIRFYLEKKGKNFQEVDINLYNGVTILTGANMSGKTVLLKSIALAQVMFQSGFFVPAQKAKLHIVEEIFLLCGDLQSIQHGLSSYAAEILYVDKAVNFANSNKKALILLDEVARTTNPSEGKAILASVLQILANSDSISLITTHYPGLNLKKIKRLRVKGLKKELFKKLRIGEKDLSDLIDYSIIPQNNEEIPEEALTIAEIIGVSNKIIHKARKILQEEQKCKVK